MNSVIPLLISMISILMCFAIPVSFIHSVWLPLFIFAFGITVLICLSYWYSRLYHKN